MWLILRYFSYFVASILAVQVGFYFHFSSVQSKSSIVWFKRLYEALNFILVSCIPHLVTITAVVLSDSPSLRNILMYTLICWDLCCKGWLARFCDKIWAVSLKFYGCIGMFVKKRCPLLFILSWSVAIFHDCTLIRRHQLIRTVMGHQRIFLPPV